MMIVQVFSGCDTVSLSVGFPTFRRVVVPSFSRVTRDIWILLDVGNHRSKDTASHPWQRESSAALLEEPGISWCDYTYWNVRKGKPQIRRLQRVLSRRSHQGMRDTRDMWDAWYQHEKDVRIRELVTLKYTWRWQKADWIPRTGRSQTAGDCEHSDETAGLISV
jgi:hypothetical protein